MSQNMENLYYNNKNMKKIKKIIKGILNPMTKFVINKKTYYPHWYFNQEKKYRFNKSSKIIIDGTAYYLEYKEKFKTRPMKRIKND